METYIALLRGINVSGQKKIKMDDLRNHLSETGLSDVRTYIQSGNLILNSDKSKEQIKLDIEKEIQDVYDFYVPVKILNITDLKKTIDNNPYSENNNDIKFLYVAFLYDLPDIEKVNNIKDYKFKDDEFIINDDIVYIYCPGGAGKTKITNNFFEKKLDLVATSRNWKTTLKLLELSEE